MFISLLKKEFRQHSALWLALFLFVIVLQLLATISYTLSGLATHAKPSFLGIAVVISVLYAAGSAAIAFCNEHEEKTYTFLRTLPIPRGTLLAGKLVWVVLGSIAFALATAVESIPWEAAFGGVTINGNDAGLVLLVSSVGLLYPISFGLFWSTRCKSQLYALLATFISGTAAAIIVAASCPPHGNGQATETENIVIFCVIALVTLIVGAIAVRNSYYWIAATEPLALARDNAHSLANARGSVVYRKRGEFRTLFLHAVRQSGGLFLAALAVGAVALLTILAIFTGSVSSNGVDLASLAAMLILCLGALTAIVFCGSVFSADQKNKGAFFAERGISPGKVWWSRILTFGGVYFGIGILLLAYPLFYGFDSPAFWSVPIWERGAIFYWFILTCIGFYVPTFFVGAIVSLFIRSGIISIVLTGMFSWLFCFWTMLLTVYLGGFQNYGISVAILTGGPLLLGCLVASRLRMDDWLRGRSLWKSRRPVLTALCLPPLIVLLAIPPYRIYSVPVVDLGYRVDPMVLERKIEWKPGFERKTYAFLNYWNFGHPDDGTPEMAAAKRAFTDPNEVLLVYDLGRYYACIETNWQWYYEVTKLEGDGLERTTSFSLGKLRQVTRGRDWFAEQNRMLERLGRERPASADIVKRIYEAEYRLAKYGYWPRPRYDKDPINTTLFIFRWFPWEKARVLRRLQNEFQMLSYHGEKADRFVFSGEGDFEELRNAFEFSRWNMERNYTTLTDNEFLLLNRWWGNRLHVVEVYGNERWRRGKIIQLALIRYRLEYDRLPETLDELVTVGYLDEIPLIPICNLPFYYDPHPKDEIMVRKQDYKSGSPILWAPSVEDVQRYDGDPFQKGNRGREMLQDGGFVPLNFTE